MLLFLLAAVGLTDIVLFGEVLDRPRAWWVARTPRPLGKLATCVMCAGFWCGVVAGLLVEGPEGPGMALARGCAGSLAAVLRHQLVAKV